MNVSHKNIIFTPYKVKNFFWSLKLFKKIPQDFEFLKINTEEISFFFIIIKISHIYRKLISKHYKTFDNFLFSLRNSTKLIIHDKYINAQVLISKVEKGKNLVS